MKDIPRFEEREREEAIRTFYELFSRFTFSLLTSKMGYGFAKVVLLHALKNASYLIGKKIKHHFGCEPVEMIGIYYGEILGCENGEMDEDEGKVRINHCPSWERNFKSLSIDCEPFCSAVIRSLLEASGVKRPEIRIIKAFPRGNSCCEFLVYTNERLNISSMLNISSI